MKSKYNLKRLEIETIAKALLEFNFQITKTAVALGISRCTLYRKIETHGLTYENVARYLTIHGVPILSDGPATRELPKGTL